MNEALAGRWWALAALVVSVLFIALDFTVLIPALPSFRRRSGPPVRQKALASRRACHLRGLVGDREPGDDRNGLDRDASVDGSRRRADPAPLALDPAQHVYSGGTSTRHRRRSGRYLPLPA